MNLEIYSGSALVNGLGLTPIMQRHQQTTRRSPGRSSFASSLVGSKAVTLLRQPSSVGLGGLASAPPSRSSSPLPASADRYCVPRARPTPATVLDRRRGIRRREPWPWEDRPRPSRARLSAASDTPYHQRLSVTSRVATSQATTFVGRQLLGTPDPDRTRVGLGRCVRTMAWVMDANRTDRQPGALGHGQP